LVIGLLDIVWNLVFGIWSLFGTSLSDLLFDLLLETNELISTIVIPEQLFTTYNSPFLLTVKEEGVVA